MRKNIGTVICEDTGEQVSVLKYYFNTLHWRRKKLAFKRSGVDLTKCYRCSKTNSSLAVYHKHFNSLGRESMADLMLLCPSCTKYLTGMYATKPSSVQIRSLLTDEPPLSVDTVDETLNQLSKGV